MCKIILWDEKGGRELIEENIKVRHHAVLGAYEMGIRRSDKISYTSSADFWTRPFELK